MVFQKGCTPWNKGLTKQRGHRGWNKGLTKETDERVKRGSEKLKGQKRSKETKQKMRKPRPEETKRKISISHIGKHHSDVAKIKMSENNKRTFLGKHHSEATKKKMREKALLRIQNNPGPYKDTEPELKMKEILNFLNIPFEHQFRVKGINHNFDFHIPNTNILIEVDGDYWHGNPEKFKKLNEAQIGNKQRDEKVNKVAKENNYILLRFWQNDILNNEEKVIERLRYYVTNSY